MLVRTALLATLAMGAAASGAAGQGTARNGSGWLGFRYTELDPVVIIQVQPGSPARVAGLEPGDTVTELNGGTATAARLLAMSASLAPGDTVRLRIRHGGRERQMTVIAVARPTDLVTVVPGQLADSLRVGLERLRERLDSMQSRRPGEFPQGTFWLGMATDSLLSRFGQLLQNDSLRKAAIPALERFVFDFGRRSVAGAELTELDPGLAQYFGNAREGLLVLRVAPGTPAALAGVQPGDIVLSVNGQPVRTVEELRRHIAMTALNAQPQGTGRGLAEGTVEVLRRGERLQLRFQQAAP
jgi:S1-C subfamily serine protease